MTDMRPPSQVMRLSRMGSAHQTRLSFMRVLLRGLRRGGWQVDCPLWQIDTQGVGRAVYRVRGQGQCYSLVAFAHDLPDELRSDRVIAEAWDASFVLVDGEPTANDLNRLARNVPLQEAGRVSDKELVLSRANRSARLWNYVVDCLASGHQPDARQLADVGYLMRTTAVYGSGKFGAADRAALSGRGLMDGPFRAEMLAVWLIRTFVCDLVEHVAVAKGGTTAVSLDRTLRRSLGIGNSTGLGMAPFLVNHPALLNAWITARETALARVLDLPLASSDTRAAFAQALAGVRVLHANWQTDHPLQKEKLGDLEIDLRQLTDQVASTGLAGTYPWRGLWQWASKALSEEGQELALSLMLEPHGPLVDDLADEMAADELHSMRVDGTMALDELKAGIDAHFGWALTPDYTDETASALFWYVSKAKLEPRLGQRYQEPGAHLEQPLDIGRSIASLVDEISKQPPHLTVAEFLQSHPQHRRAVRRIQLARTAPYGEIQDNLLAADTLPIDMLRCKLAFFGATRFDPRSDRWVRITMYQNAPFPDELHALPEDAWSLPVPDAA